MNITIEFCVFELGQLPNFSLNWQFWFFGPSFSKNGILSLKRIKWTPPFNSAYNCLGSKSQLKLIFWARFAHQGQFQSGVKTVSIAILRIPTIIRCVHTIKIKHAITKLKHRTLVSKVWSVLLKQISNIFKQTFL